MEQIDFSNFFDATWAIFQPCDRPDRAPDFTSPSGSQYWDTRCGVIRQSDHWGWHVASCKWECDDRETIDLVEGPTPVIGCGYCAYADFRYYTEESTEGERLAVIDWFAESLKPIRAVRTERAFARWLALKAAQGVSGKKLMKNAIITFGEAFGERVARMGAAA